jgi:hypothetical protein
MEEELLQVLKDYVATANNSKYGGNWETINSKFPELKSYDPQLLKDYVATANNSKYGGNWETINSKFPEFNGSVKKKEPTTPSAPSTQPLPNGGQSGQGTIEGSSFIPSTLQGVFPDQVVSQSDLPENYELGSPLSAQPKTSEVPTDQLDLLLSASANQYSSSKRSEAQESINLTPYDFNQNPKYIGPLGKQLFTQNIAAEQKEIDRLNASREEEISQIVEQGGADEETIKSINKRYDDLISSSQKKIDQNQEVLSEAQFDIGKEVESIAESKRKEDKDAPSDSDKPVLSRLEMASADDANYEELKRYSKNKNALLGLISLKFAGMEEEDAVVALKKRMGALDADFQYLDFQESGATGDYLTIVNKFTGDEMEFFLDNDNVFSQGMDRDQSNKIRSYIDIQMEFPEYTYLTDKIRKMEYEALANPDLFGVTQNEYGGISKRKENAWEDIKSGAKYRSNPTMYNMMYDADNQNLIALNRNPEYIEAKRQLSGVISDMSSYALKDDNTAFAFSKMKANDASMSLGFDKVELERAKYDQSVNQELYDQEMNSIMSSLDSYRDVSTGEIDFSQVPEEEKKLAFDRISLLENNLGSSQELVSDITDDINTKQENINKVASSAAIAAEDHGTPLSDIKHAAFRGLVAIPSFVNRVESTFNPDVEVITKDDMARFIGGQGVTQEYSSSEDRAFAQKVLVSLTESISTAVSSGGLLSPQTAFTLSSTVDALEQMDDPAFDDISAAEKWVYSGIYGTAMGALENLGFSKSISKTPAGKAAIRALFHKTLKELPKDASLEMLETSLKETARATILKGGLDIVTSSLAEGGTEYVQEGVDATMKLLYNKIRNEDLFETYDSFAEFNDSAWEQALLGAAGGGMMQGTTKIINGKASTWDKKSVEMIDRVVNGESSKSFNEHLATLVAKGEMTQEEAESKIKSAEDAKEIFDSIPQNIKGDSRYDAFSLIAEKKEIEKQIQGKDSSLVSAQSERLTQINQELKEIADKAGPEKSANEQIIESLEEDIRFEKESEFGGNEETIKNLESQISSLKAKTADSDQQLDADQKTEDTSSPSMASENIDLKYEEGADTEYKIDDGFYKESDFIEKLNDPEFMAQVENGEVVVQVQNPSQAVESLVLTEKTVQNEVQQTEETQDQAQDEEVVTFDKDPEATPTLTGAIKQTNGNLSRLSGKANQETRRKIIEEVTGEKVPLSKAGINNLIAAVDGYLGVDTGKVRPRINDDISSWANKQGAKKTKGTPTPISRKQEPTVKVEPPTPSGKTITTTAGQNSRQKKFVLNSEPNNHLQAIKQAILSGLRLDKAEMGREAKLSESEMKERKTFFKSTTAGGAKVLSIDDMIEYLKTSSRDLFKNVPDSQIRQDIIDIFTENRSTTDLQQSLTEDFSVDGVLYERVNDRTAAATFQNEMEQAKASEEQEAISKQKEEDARLEADIEQLSEEQILEEEASLNEYLETLTDEEIEEQFGEYDPERTNQESTTEGEGSNLEEDTAVKEKEVDSEKDQKGTRKESETEPPTPKTPETEGKTKGPEKVSRMSKRAAEKTDDPEIEDLLKRVGKYNVKTNEGVTKYVNDLISAMGPEGAYQYASLNTKIDRVLKNAVIATAGIEMAKQAKIDLDKAQESGDTSAEADARDRMYQGYDILNQSSIEKTISGQDIQYTKELYKKYPSMFQLALLQKFENSNSGELDVEYSTDEEGNPVTARDEIQNLQERLMEKVDEEVSKKMDDILERLESTENENESLRQEIEKMKSSYEKKLGTKKQRVQKAKKKRSDAIDKLKKAGKGGNLSASFIGLNDQQVEAILDIISSFVEEGVAKSDVIITKTLKIVRDTTKEKSITKGHIENIADQIDKFNGLKRVEAGKKQKTLVEKVFSVKTETSPGSIDESIQNQTELWERYQNDSLSKILSSLRKGKKSNKKKALLDSLNNAIKSHVSETISNTKKKSSKKKNKNKEDVFEVISDLISNQDKINRLYKALLSNSDVFTKDQIQQIENLLSEHNSSQFKITPSEAKKVINEGQTLTGQDLKEIVRSHYKGRHGYARTLAQSIMEDTDVDAETAEAIAKSLEDDLKSTIDSLVEKELTKMLNNDNVSIEELRRKKRDGSITGVESDDLKKRIKASKNQKVEKKIIDAINMGALNRGRDFESAFEAKFGFKNLPSSVKAKLISITDRIANLEANVSKELLDAEGNVIGTVDAKYVEQVARLQREFNTLLESQLSWNTAIVLREIVSAQYIGMLSSPKTFGRAFIGGYSSGLLGAIAFNLRNAHNIKGLYVGYKAMAKSVPAAWSRARAARKTGYDFFGDNALKGEYTSSRKSRVESALFEGLGDGINSLYDKEASTPYLKRLFKTSLKAVAQTLKVVHVIGALDAFMNTLGGSMVGATNEYKAQAKLNGKNKSMNMTVTDHLQKKKIRDAAYEKIAEDEYNDLVKDIQKEVKSENNRGEFTKSGAKISEEAVNIKVKQRLRNELGIKGSVTASPRRTYKTRRVQELRENAMGRYFEEGIDLSKDASLMGKPDGVVGLNIEKFQGALNIKADDNAFLAFGKFTLNALFKFVRMTGVVMNKSMNNIPVIGIMNSWIGPGWDPVNKEWDKSFWGKARANPELAKQRTAMNVLISTMFFAVMSEMFEFGDEDEDMLERAGNIFNPKKWRLDPNRRIDIRGFGFGGMGGAAKNRRMHEDWENISFSVTKDENGRFTNYMTTRLTTELAAVSASAGVFTDDFKNDASEDDIYLRKESPAWSYSKRLLSNNMRLFTESSFSSVGRIGKNFMMKEDFVDAFTNSVRGVIVDNTRSVVNPGAGQFITSFFTSSMGMNDPDYSEDILVSIFRGGYGLDMALSDKDRTDVFGNPYPKTNDINSFVYGLEEKRSEKFEKTVGLLYKFDQGLDIGKWRNNDMKNGKTFSVPGKRGKEFRSMSDDVSSEALKMQEEYFRESVIKKYNRLNSIKERDDLNKAIKKLQAESKKKAKNEILKKYFDKSNPAKGKIVLVNTEN